MIIKKNIFFFIFLMYSAQLSAQIFEGNDAQKIIKGANRIVYDNNFQAPVYIQFEKGTDLDVYEIESWIYRNLKISKEFSFKLIQMKNDSLGWVKYKFQELYKGVPIEGAKLTVCTSSGKIASISSLLITNLSLYTIPKYDERIVTNQLSGYVKEKKYKWDIENKNSKTNKIETFPKGKLVILKKDVSYYLAYRYSFYSTDPFVRKSIYVDASSNKIIYEINEVAERHYDLQNNYQGEAGKTYKARI